MAKVTVVGAGNVGATCAQIMAQSELVSEIVVLDIKSGYAEGKTMDLMQTAGLLGFDTRIVGSTNDYSKTADSDVVVITSGLPRKPGMTREELINSNAGIVRTVVENILAYSPDAVLVVVSNPVDAMTYLVQQVSGLPRQRVLGLGGALDSARFKYYLSQALGVPATDIQAFVIGGHGDTTMLPVISQAVYLGIPVNRLLDETVLKQVVSDTMAGGATLTSLLGTSAWYGPGTAAAAMVEAIIRDERRVLPCSVCLEGEYGQQDICLGVPVVLGRNGWEKVIELELNAAEQESFAKSAAAVRTTNQLLVDLKRVV